MMLSLVWLVILSFSKFDVVLGSQKNIDAAFAQLSLVPNGLSLESINSKLKLKFSTRRPYPILQELNPPNLAEAIVDNVFQGFVSIILNNALQGSSQGTSVYNYYALDLLSREQEILEYIGFENCLKMINILLKNTSDLPHFLNSSLTAHFQSLVKMVCDFFACVLNQLQPILEDESQREAETVEMIFREVPFGSYLIFGNVGFLEEALFKFQNNMPNGVVATHFPALVQNQFMNASLLREALVFLAEYAPMAITDPRLLTYRPLPSTSSDIIGILPNMAPLYRLFLMKDGLEQQKKILQDYAEMAMPSDWWNPAKPSFLTTLDLILQDTDFLTYLDRGRIARSQLLSLFLRQLLQISTIQDMVPLLNGAMRHKCFFVYETLLAFYKSLIEPRAKYNLLLRAAELESKMLMSITATYLEFTDSEFEMVQNALKTKLRSSSFGQSSSDRAALQTAYSGSSRFILQIKDTLKSFPYSQLRKVLIIDWKCPVSVPFSEQITPEMLNQPDIFECHSVILCSVRIILCKAFEISFKFSHAALTEAGTFTWAGGVGYLNSVLKRMMKYINLPEECLIQVRDATDYKSETDGWEIIEK